uniref:Carbamoylphosphate synthase large subunit n=1 Tax=Klebsiella pneumoniae TaxID=573 RepID=A0A8B0SVD8_KLEPN|nr:Carbamoylphosphate synthase large subunit [Klebsiella pneumoniae]
MGFWRFDDNVSPVAFFSTILIAVLSTHHNTRLLMPVWTAFTPQVLMPYLPGPEYSVDMVVSQGTVPPLSGGVKKVCFSIWKMKGKRLNLPSTAPA